MNWGNLVADRLVAARLESGDDLKRWNALAADAPQLTAPQVHALVLEGKTVVRLAEGMELHRSRVMGVNRIELSGFSESAKDRLKADGFFSEIISCVI